MRFREPAEISKIRIARVPLPKGDRVILSSSNDDVFQEEDTVYREAADAYGFPCVKPRCTASPPSFQYLALLDHAPPIDHGAIVLVVFIFILIFIINPILIFVVVVIIIAGCGRLCRFADSPAGMVVVYQTPRSRGLSDFKNFSAAARERDHVSSGKDRCDTSKASNTMIKKISG